MIVAGIDLDVLRADFRLVRAWFVEFDEWTEDQADEVAWGIKAAVEDDTSGELAFWAEWMARMAEAARAHRAGLLRLAEEARRERELHG